MIWPRATARGGPLQTATDMIIALYQGPEPTSLSAGLATVDEALGGAAEAHAQMLVMPETFLPGYAQVSAQPPLGWDDVHPALSDLCKRHAVGLTIGLPEFQARGVFNTAVVFDAQGQEIARYAKRQLFGADEAALYQPGQEEVVFDYGGIRFGLLICYDVEFPEYVRSLARKGAEVILVPTANMMPFTNVNQIMVPSRAAENAVTVVYANYAGHAGDLTYTALSRIVGPDGSTLAGLEDGVGLCFADISDLENTSRIPWSTQIQDYLGDG